MSSKIVTFGVLESAGEQNLSGTIRFQRVAHSPHFNPAHDICHLALIEQNGPFVREVRNQFIQMKYFWPKIALKFGFTGKNDHREKGVFREAKQGLDRFQVPIVLVKGILKCRPFPENNLSPVTVIWAPENPSLVVFGFDHENSGVRDQQMVNLCRPVVRLKRHVV